MKGKMFVKKIKSYLEIRDNCQSYIEYTDSEGNKLKRTEILFTTEESFQGKQTLEVWGEEKNNIEYYTVESPGVELIYDDAGNFPVALRSPEGKLMYLKVSAKTGEVLPTHTGCCLSLDVIYTGPPSAGKTVNILQVSDSAFHDAIVRNTGCCLEDDLPSSAPARKRYEEAGDNLKRHILPDATKRGEYIMPYVFYVTYKNGEEKRHILLRFQDIDGEECVDMGWNSKVLPYNYFFLTIPANELVAGEKNEPVAYTKVVDKMIPKLRVLRKELDYEIVVIISKCDLLDRNNHYLKDAFNNSVEINNGRMYQTIHDNGFDYDAFRKRGDCIKAYLKEECPNFYNKLTNALPEEKITFSMIASIGTSPQGNTFTEWNPFCIDEPVLSILANNNMYPILKNKETPEVETIESCFSLEKRVKEVVKNLKDFINEKYYDEDEFEEELVNVEK